MVTKVTSYFHTQSLFEIAKRASSKDLQDEDSSIVAIMFSVSALEAFINESGALANMVPTSKLQKRVKAYSAIMKELEDRKEALLVKYHMGLLIFAGSTWDEGAKPYQDFRLLVSLRNAILHMKGDKWEVQLKEGMPEPEREMKQYPKFVQTLRDRKLIDKPAKSSSWLQLINNPRVGRWACETASNITKVFADSIPKGFYKTSLKTDLLLSVNHD